MVRRFEPEENRSFRPLYWIAVIAVIVLWIWAFKMYLDRYEYLHPDITWAVPGVDTKLIKINGVLLWKEVPVIADREGIVSYPQGTGPVRVGRGAVIARITSGAMVKDIKAYQQGYFIAGVDGLESSWRYSEIWPGIESLPEPRAMVKMKDGMLTGRGQPVGKIIEQPQELRFVGCAEATEDILKQIKNKRLKVKMDESDTGSFADIRVSMRTGHKVRLYVTLPWFRAEDIRSRKYTLVAETGRTEGAMVPESALLERDGKQGVYMIRGSRVVFTPVEGKRVSNGKFLVTKGLSVGDAVVEDAASAREGRVQLW